MIIDAYSYRTGAAKSAILAIAVLSMLFCSCIVDNRKLPAPSLRIEPDIISSKSGTIASCFLPGNPYSVRRVKEITKRSEVQTEMQRFILEGYRYAPGKSFVVTGASSAGELEVILIGLDNALDVNSNAIYLACIDNGKAFGVSPAIFSFEDASPDAGFIPFGQRSWIKLPGAQSQASAAAQVDSGSDAEARWSWEEWWSCLASVALAASAGCAVTCIPSLPEGYLACYLTCMGGAIIAGAVLCTFQQWFGG